MRTCTVTGLAITMKPFRIFRPGRHVASCGTAVEFTEEDLKRAVAAYSPAVYAAPLVIGHPKMEDRAYGWAEALTYEDGHVVAHPDKVNPEFGELVAQGAYRNRSASWYMPDHPNNPKPGVLYPKHIGFLGAVPPSLKGLGDVQFSEAAPPLDFSAEQHPDKVLEFMDAEGLWTIASVVGTLGRFMRSLRDMRIEEKGVEEADRVLPEWVIQDAETSARELRAQAAKADSGPMLPSYTEPTQNPENRTMTPEQIAALQAENADAKAKLAQFQEREVAIAAAERMASVASIDARLAPLVQAGKLLPKARTPLANFMADLADGEAARTIEFGEAQDGKPAPKVSPREFMFQFLEGLPKVVHFGEIAGGGTGTATMTPQQLADKATAHRAKVKAETGREMSFTEATNAVLAEAGVSVADNTPTAA